MHNNGGLTMSNENSFPLSSNQPELLISKMSISQTPQSDSDFSLSEKDFQEIDAFVNQIDITDSFLIIHYGRDCQIQIANISNSISELIIKHDPQHIRESIRKVTQIINDFHSYRFSAKKSISFKNRFKADKKAVHKIKNELDSQSLILDDYNDELLAFYSQLETLYITITKYIIAGEKKLNQLKTGVLPELKENSTTSISSAQEYNNMMQCINYFEDRIHSLCASQTNALLQRKQISLQLNNNNQLKSVISGIIDSTIPAFEQSGVI